MRSRTDPWASEEDRFTSLRGRRNFLGVLFALPPVLILLAWARGCRAEERPIVIAVAAVSGLGFLAALAWALTAQLLLARGAAYALMTIAMSALAMLLRVRPDDDGPGPSEAADRLPPDFDWDEFERGFRRELARRERRRLPV